MKACRILRTAARLAPVLCVVACSGPSDKDVFVLTPPARDTFLSAGVGDVLEINCGTLDCHGQPGRNMRIFGINGLRLSPNGITGYKGTTDAEYEATYESVIAIEPERLSRIVQSRGAGIDQWIVLGKGRGVQHHKGGTRLVPGSPADTCVVSWIAGKPDNQACQNGQLVQPPGLQPGENW